MIRVYEPNPVKITSMEDVESSEKHLVDTLIRVMQRKVLTSFSLAFVFDLISFDFLSKSKV